MGQFILFQRIFDFWKMAVGSTLCVRLSVLGVETGSSFVHFQGQKLDPVLYTFKGRNWIKFCTLLGMETGSNFVHFQGQKLDHVLYTFRGRNWIKFCTLLGMETGSNFVHFQGQKLNQILYTFRGRNWIKFCTLFRNRSVFISWSVKNTLSYLHLRNYRNFLQFPLLFWDPRELKIYIKCFKLFLFFSFGKSSLIQY